jgi:uncharacterized protein
MQLVNGMGEESTQNPRIKTFLTDLQNISKRGLKLVTYKILTIDGGGILGTFPASFLATIETSLQRAENDSSLRLVDYFDLIAGTSTGGIIALGLGLGFSCSEILKFYQKYGPQIFRKSPRRAVIERLVSFIPSSGVRRVLVDGFREKYEASALENALSETFGQKMLGHSRVRLIIPSMNPDRGSIHMWKTAHHPRFERDYLAKAVNVARATSAAPTYFEVYISERGMPFIDGGMCANNPIAVAVTEAIGVLNWPREQLELLSLGCTSQPLDLTPGSPEAKRLGELYWAEHLLDTMMAGQSTTALGQSELLVGKEKIIRIDPLMPAGRFTMDSADQIKRLVGLGESYARDAIPEVRKKFLQEKSEKFVPYHYLQALLPDE